MTGKRRTKQRKVDRALAKGALLLHCQYCTKVFVQTASLTAHLKDAHGPHAKGKTHHKASNQGNRGTSRMPVHNGPNGGNFTPTINPHPRPAIMEIDFISPNQDLKCITCGMAGAMPLTSYCPSCDPVVQAFQIERLIEEDEKERRRIRASERGSSTPATGNSSQGHSNVLALPRPDPSTSGNPAPASATDTIRRALANGHPKPTANGIALLDANGEAIIPAFLRRPTDISLETHDRLLK